MAENPLLPDAELRGLLHLTRHCARLDAATARKSASPLRRPGPVSAALPGSRAALLAGTALQLKPGDLLLCEPRDLTASSLSPRHQEADAISWLPEPKLPPPTLLLATAMAAALRATGSDRLMLHYVQADVPQASWAEALAWAQQRLLPLILVFPDSRGSGAFRPATAAKGDRLTWSAVQATAAKLQIPVLTVDGEDAVAVYRVMQESVLRARVGGGPAILWAMLPAAKELQTIRPRGVKPVERLERYLKARKITF